MAPRLTAKRRLRWQTKDRKHRDTERANRQAKAQKRQAADLLALMLAPRPNRATRRAS